MLTVVPKAAAVGLLAVLVMGGGLCPRSSPGPDDDQTGLYAYIRREGSGSAMYVANREGSIFNQIGLGLSPPLNPTDGVSLSPERWRVVFAMPDVAGGNNDIFVVNRDGTALLDLTQTPDTNETVPDWSRAGNSIAYEADGDIWIVRTDGSGKRQVTQTPGIAEADPSWSPDGARIVYTLNPDSPNSDIEAINVDTLERVPIAADANYDEYTPSWSPSGTRIAFAARPLTGSAMGEEVDVSVINIDGTGRRNVTHAQGDVLCLGPAWAPDESRLAFRGTRRGETNSDIYEISPAGEGLRPLVYTTQASETYVDWR